MEKLLRNFQDQFWKCNGRLNTGTSSPFDLPIPNSKCLVLYGKYLIYFYSYSLISINLEFFHYSWAINASICQVNQCKLFWVLNFFREEREHALQARFPWIVKFSKFQNYEIRLLSMNKRKELRKRGTPIGRQSTQFSKQFFRVNEINEISEEIWIAAPSRGTESLCNHKCMDSFSSRKNICSLATPNQF